MYRMEMLQRATCRQSLKQKAPGKILLLQAGVEWLAGRRETGECVGNIGEACSKVGVWTAWGFDLWAT